MPKRKRKIAASIFGIALVVALTTAPAAAATTVTNGDIAYDQTDGETSDIYSSHPDGSNPDQLTNESSGYPQWSPDGSQIAYESGQDGNSEVYKMNADGSGKTNLTNDPSLDQSPSWGPGGAQLVFSSDRSGQGLEIYRMNADGSDQTRLTDNFLDDAFPLWSPDGTRIAFQRDNSEIWMMNADGSNQFFLNQFGMATDWSPDGTKLLAILSTDGQLYTIDSITGTAILQLTSSGTPYWASYSPDGKRIVYTYTPLEPNLEEEGVGNQDVLLYQVYTMNADGSNKTLITNDDFDHFYVDWQPIIAVTPDPAIANTVTPNILTQKNTLPAAGTGVAGYGLAVGGLAAARFGRKRWDIQRKHQIR